MNDQWADIDILWMNQKWRNGKNNGFQSVNSTNPKCNGSIVIAEKMNSDSMDPKDVHIYLFNLKGKLNFMCYNWREKVQCGVICKEYVCMVFRDIGISFFIYLLLCQS